MHGNWSPWKFYNMGGTCLTETILYSNSAGTTGTVTLSETSANFTYLEIYYGIKDEVNIVDSIKISNPNGKKPTLFVGKTDTAGFFTHYGNTVNISGTSITRNRGAQYNINTNNVLGDFGSQTPPQISILKVIGYR